MSSDEPSRPDGLLLPPDPPRPEDAIGIAPSAPPERRTRRRFPFRRSTSDRYLAGIAGGEGHRLGIDPFFLRVALVGATLLFARDGGGSFVVVPLLYLVAWLCWPTDDEPSLVRRLTQRPAQQEIGGAVAAFALATLVIGRPNLIWAGILLGAALALLGRGPAGDTGSNLSGEPGPEPSHTSASEQTAAPDGAPHQVPLTPQERAITWGRSRRGMIGPRTVPGPPRLVRQRPPRRAPALWPLTVSLLMAFGFGCVLLDNLVEPGIDPGMAVNGALSIIGGVILLSAWRGRALVTSLLLVPLAPAWVAFSVADTPRFADTATLVSPREGYVDGQVIEASKGYGGLSMWLEADDLPATGEITAKVGLTAGQADIWVPKEARLHIVGQVGLGQIDVYEERDWWAYDSEPLVDYGLDRRYAALGRTCFETVDSEEGLRNVAEWSDVAVPSGADGDAVADAIEAAGYPRPTSETLTEAAFEQALADGYVEETDGITYDEFGNEVAMNETTGNVEDVVWTYQTNENGGLCSPVPPPADPVLITIDATIGLGNLKVHRV